MKATREPGRRSLTTEYVTSKLWVSVLFPGSADEAAALPSKMGSFPWTFVEYKEHNGFVFVNCFPARDQIGGPRRRAPSRPYII